ncbi:hypothetical protein FB554_1362 [Barrientosiimonas humi]|uniref:Uncharacterized protein n=1 Tax=Barrientosiimonas humi TaxID=999931 RepID=A0A542XBS1_9MICO|nr:hypothetical protein [Barrientosiimonas humi]TQL33224.1 hypothetical protein FB554_1362 [Barrientosiimonas humi]CAG7573213.1 hypothetical protein BH39T_PBIAJDOK_01840 [Barrientosiimonas humi]
MTTTHPPTLYVGSCATCGWKTEPARYVEAGDLTEQHSDICPEASTEVWPMNPTDPSDLLDSHDGRVRAYPPRFVCPGWCTTPHEQHVADLRDMEGQVVHHGVLDKDQETEIWLCEATWPAGETTGVAPTLTVVGGDVQELTAAEARTLAGALLRAAESLESGQQPEVAR